MICLVCWISVVVESAEILGDAVSNEQNMVINYHTVQKAGLLGYIRTTEGVRQGLECCHAGYETSRFQFPAADNLSEMKAAVRGGRIQRNWRGGGAEKS